MTSCSLDPDGSLDPLGPLKSFPRLPTYVCLVVSTYGSLCKCVAEPQAVGCHVVVTDMWLILCNIYVHLLVPKIFGRIQEYFELSYLRTNYTP